MEKRNILMVGNGYDRLLGLQSDYISWLNNIENKDGLYNLIIGLDYYQFRNLEEMESVLDGEKINFGERKGQWVIANKKIFEQETEQLKYKEFNIWEEYFKFLKYVVEKFPNIEFGGIKILKDLSVIQNTGNWIDLEKLIELTIFNDKISIISKILEVKLKMTGQDKKEKEHVLLEDFKKCKLSLTTYLGKNAYQINPERSNYVFHAPYIWKGLDYTKYDEIVNFNYTKSFENSDTEGKVRKIHGNLTDGENIVFGANNKHYTRKADSSANICNELFKNSYYEYTKMFQLQSLNTLRDYGFSTEGIKSVSILGHSLSEQDYNYFFSILDNNAGVVIEYLYYSWTDGEDQYSNKEEGTRRIFEMMEQYELYSKKNMYYTMNFEGRIKFKEVKIPDLIKCKELNLKDSIKFLDESQVEKICDLIKYSNGKNLENKLNFIKSMIQYAEAFNDKEILLKCNNKLINLPYNNVGEQEEVILNKNRKYYYSKHVKNEIRGNSTKIKTKDKLIMFYDEENILLYFEVMDLIEDINKIYENLEVVYVTIKYGDEILLEINPSRKNTLEIKYKHPVNIEKCDMSNILKNYPHKKILWTEIS